MASSVGEGGVAPLAQAEPSEAATPARSSCIRRRVAVEAGEADVERLREPSRGVGRPVARRPRPGPSAAIRPGSSRSRSRSPAGDPGLGLGVPDRRGRRPGRRPGPRGTVPGRDPLCWPPPSSDGLEPDAPADQQQARHPPARGTCGARRQRGHAQARGSRPAPGRPPARRRCGPGRPRDPPRPRGQLGDGLDRAGLVVGEHQGRQPRRRAGRRRPSPGVGQALGRRPPGRSTANPRCLQPRDRLGDGRVLDRAGDDRPGRAPRPSARPKIARLFASVPPEVKTTSSGSAPRIAATVSRASSRPAARPGRRRGGSRGCPPASQCGRIASSTPGSSGVVALWSR